MFLVVWRHGNSAALVTRTVAMAAVAARGLVAAARRPPAAINAGWADFELIDQADTTRDM